VTFKPKAAGVRAAFGRTDASGRFQLTTVLANDGAMVGPYAVLVSKTVGPAAAAGGDTYDPSDPAGGGARESYYASQKEGGEPEEPQNLLPAKYTDAATSGLTAEVKADGQNEFQFDLSDS